MRSSLLRILLLLLLIQAPGARGEVVERILAVVNGQVLTETSLTRYRLTAELVEGRLPGAPEEALERLINRTLLLQEIHRLGLIKLGDDAVQRELRLRAESSGGEAELRRSLEARGLSWPDLLQHLRDRLRISLFVDQRVGAFVDVSPMEADEFCRTEFGITAPTELTSEIRENAIRLLRMRKVDTRLAELLEELRRRARIRRPGDVAETVPEAYP